MAQWRGRRVLVTGAGGFIGSHLAERLAELGAEVRAFVHYNGRGRRGWLETSPRVADMEIVAGDVSDRDSITNAAKGIDTIFHLAALIAIPYSYRAPVSYVRVNIEGTLNVLEAARAHGIRRVLHTSTSEVYGTALRIPIAEDHPLQGQSPYSASKIAADKMAEAYYRSFAVPVVTIRPFNTYGPRQSARAVVPTIVAQALAGTKVKLGNLTPTRDLNFVADTVEGFVKASDAPAVEGRVINLGSGREIAIGDLAALIGKLMGRALVIEAQDDRLRPKASEVDRLLADATLAKTLLGWAPSMTLEEGLARTIVWCEANRDSYRAEEYAV